MKQYNSSKPLISIHIPKCAGTSFHKVLSLWFGEKLKYHYLDEQANKMPERHVIEGNDGMGLCIHGHFNKSRKLGIKDYYPEVTQFVTMLRDPFQVFVSRYFYLRNLTSLNINYRNGDLYDVGDFDDFIKNERSSILLHMPVEVTMSNFKDVIEEYFVYIGIVEDLRNSVDRLAEELGYQTVQLEHLNKTERDIDLPNRYREVFMQRHPVEYAMYEYVSARYNRQ